MRVWVGGKDLSGFSSLYAVTLAFADPTHLTGKEQRRVDAGLTVNACMAN